MATPLHVCLCMPAFDSRVARISETVGLGNRRLLCLVVGGYVALATRGGWDLVTPSTTLTNNVQLMPLNQRGCN